MKSSELMVTIEIIWARLSRFSMLVDDGMVKEMFDENGPSLEKVSKFY